MDGNAIRTPARTLLKPVLPETALFAMLCTVDMVVTVVLIAMGLAVEANPVLAKPLMYSIGAFVAVKTISYIVPLAIAEVMRPRSPLFIQRVLQLGLCGYLLVYGIASLGVNKEFVIQALAGIRI